MFTLSQQHQAAFHNKAEGKFINAVIDYLRKNNNDTNVDYDYSKSKISELTDLVLSGICHEAISKAYDYGFSEESQIFSFVLARIFYGNEFDKSEAFDFLVNPKISYPLKTMMLNIAIFSFNKD